MTFGRNCVQVTHATSCHSPRTKMVSDTPQHFPFLAVFIYKKVVKRLVIAAAAAAAAATAAAEAAGGT